MLRRRVRQPEGEARPEPASWSTSNDGVVRPSHTIDVRAGGSPASRDEVERLWAEVLALSAENRRLRARLRDLGRDGDVERAVPIDSAPVFDLSATDAERRAFDEFFRRAEERDKAREWLLR